MRAKDMHMGATIYPSEKTIFITGAIDTNDFKIKVRVKLPESGIWHIVKAETNLTNDTWLSWKVGVGEGNSIPTDAGLNSSCRQFASVKELADQDCVVFYNGEVRPGEPILKSFFVSVEEGTTELCLNHSRQLKSESLNLGTNLEDVLDYYAIRKLPEIEILIPSVVVSQQGQQEYQTPDFQYA